MKCRQKYPSYIKYKLLDSACAYMELLCPCP